ncbi:retrotransposon protein, putative, ty1-copia subclass [Tanacetum coccineum]
MYVIEQPLPAAPVADSEAQVKNKSLKAKSKGKASVKGNDKQVYIPKPKNLNLFAKEHPAKDDTYYHCKEVGHWKRNCPVYLAELLKKKKKVSFASSSGIFETGCGTQICITKQRFREARKLKLGALYMYVGNDVHAQVEAIGSFDLVLPNGLVICLDTCHYAPSITRGVVLVHRLVENGFVQCFTNFGISFSRNNVFYFNVIPSNGIYEIDMRDLVPNVNFIYNMTRKSFPHHPERATYLLGIIHTDVCGPLRHVSRQGASYFITFTDDYSRYGYVYLLKHKHELTPPYTPQHNDVSAKRKHTLLDMVRSMMNLTTLSLSFWDYSLESTTRILNMVPTKKVDKTPYELLYGKVPNLSYLKETMGCYFYFPLENKIVVARCAEFFEKNLITQEVSGRTMDIEEIQDEDTSPSEVTNEIPMEVKGFKPPQEEVITVRRSKRLIGLGQNAYMDKILKRYKMDNSKCGHIPIQERLDLNKTQGASTPKEVKCMQNVPYASIVGSIINPEAELQVDYYCNARFETDIDDIKCLTGYVFILNGSAVD